MGVKLKTAIYRIRGIDDEPQLLYTVGEACQMLRLGRSSIYAVLGSPDLPIVKVGRSTRIHRDDLERFARSRRVVTGIAD